MREYYAVSTPQGETYHDSFNGAVRALKARAKKCELLEGHVYRRFQDNTNDWADNGMLAYVDCDSRVYQTK